MTVNFRVPRHRGRVLATIVSIGALMAVVGCGSSGTTSGSSSKNWADVTSAPSSFSELVAAAKSEGSVTISAPLTTQEEAAFQEFTKEYGVTVNAEDQPSSVAGSSVETQESTGRVTTDLIQTSNFSQMQQFAKEGYLEKYSPQTAADYPASTEISGYAYPVGDSDVAIAWNTKTTPQAVQKELETDPYKALLSPSLKGKILLIDANIGGSGMATYSNLIYNVAGYGWSYMTKLAAQNPAIGSSNTTIVSEITSGTYDVTNFAPVGTIGQAIAAGAPARFVTPSPDPTTQFDEAIVHGAPHPAAARLFEEWSEGHAGQEAITNALGFTSQLKGWVNEQAWTKKLPWYSPPAQTYLSWQVDPRLTGNNLTAFLAKWSQIYHHSS